MPMGGCKGSCREGGELDKVLLSTGHPSMCLEKVCSMPSKSMLLPMQTAILQMTPS